MILIVTRKDDVHADVVTLELDKLGEAYFRLNTEAIDEYDITLSPKKATLVHRATDRRLCSESVKSVYLRRRSIPEFPIDTGYASFVQSEWKGLLRNMWVLLASAFWISHPDAIEQTSDKIAQLRLAREIGFEIPETILTNSIVSVNQLQNKCGELIYKAIHSGEINRSTGQVIYTSSLKPDLLSNDHTREFQVCPAFYQPRIPKDYEVRVTVVGTRVFATKIDSQISVETSLDWRRYGGGNLRHGPYELEQPVADKCVEVVRSFKLEFGAIDLIKNKAGYVFLEINANGQWAWIEACTKYPIARSVAELLAR